MLFTMRVTMLSDWHIGLGQSKGDVDAIVQRDRDGLPYIPGKTLTGILRDSCELAALGLDNGNEKGVWSQWVDFLFGTQPALEEGAIESSPQPAIVSLRSAHFPDSLKNALSVNTKVKDAIAFIKPGISIDNDTGCAKTDFLRFEEMIRKGAILDAKDCQINYPADISDDDKKRVEALLLAGAKLTERIGGKRRRGAGKCKIEFLKVKNDNYLDYLSQTPSSPPVYQEINPPVTSQYPEIKESDWYILPLEITAKSPLIINSRTVGNVVETLDYIPGKYILRNLHRKLGQWLNISQAISEESLVITNATVSSKNQPSRPVPFCLFADKLKGGLDKGNVYNRLVEDNPKDLQLKGIRGGYVGEVTHNHLPIYRKVAINVYTHNTIEDELQRPSSDVGGVYSYSAIAPKTTFRAEIRLKSDLFNHLNKQKKQWWKNLEGSYSIGQSKKDDYGTIKVTIAQQPQLHQGKIQLDNNTLSVWLLSDLLLRDKRLNPTADLNILKETLEKTLGVTLEEKQKIIRQRRTESWQVRWGLSRPSLVGIQAGSCIVYEVTEGELDINQLSQIQMSGIGERRVEGYGQMCFNDPLLTMELSKLTPSVTEVDTSNDNVNVNLIKNNDSSFEYARIIEREAWREAIQQQALDLASDRQTRKQYLGLEIQGEESKPPMTQLGALRSVVSKLQSQNDKQQVTNWIKALESVPNRKEKWVGDSLKLIRSLINDERKIWEYLHLPKDLNITHSAETELKMQLWAEAIRTFIDAMIRAHKRDWEKTQ
ncbi:RAMP superfamily CRISPR-associated protein [Cyanobacterium aponinum UTEX 3222]|uniref:RAMP superfamily CRISPR-associated protein n=1 Tax=Cyanobacterium aponinum TaxID=379064 RepID=UPI003089E02F|nr:RAMP superfamily CRISPR-associated protein [Cyanobacterium aponinum UTEX 3222]